MKTNGPARKSAKAPAFVRRAERALRRAAKTVQTQNRALKLPLIVWQDGKVVEKTGMKTEDVRHTRRNRESRKKTR